MLKYSTIRLVEVSQWDNLVQDTYEKPYNFQQQDGCKSRGIEHLTVNPECFDYEEDEDLEEDYTTFKQWLAQDPKTYPIGEEYDKWDWQRDMYWEREFYPSAEVIAGDLCRKGLVEAGSYMINIDW